MHSGSFHIRRRDLLRSLAVIAGSAALPGWFNSSSLAADAPARSASVNSQPSIALIGCGGMGRNDANLASKFGRINFVCDLDARRMHEAAVQFGAKEIPDFRDICSRKDIDIVICGTVDHWHTLVSIAAMRGGKDVYCEKPLTLTIDEGKQIIKTAKQTKRILQTGSQQRSDPRFRLACELVRNKRIGKVHTVTTILPAGRREGPFTKSSSPEEFDWDFWQGQTPNVDYVTERTHVTFRYWYDYSGGTMTDWGAHHNDIVLWGLGLERSGPTSIEGKSLVEMIKHGFTAASQYEINYTYANGIRHMCRSTNADNWSGGVVTKEGEHHGVKFEGDQGWIFVTRGRIEASRPDILQDPLGHGATRLYASDDHMANFFNSVHTRKPAICEPEIGHRSASLCHLGVLAMRLGRKLNWDPRTETFVNDKDAGKWLAREMRKPYTYDMIA